MLINSPEFTYPKNILGVNTGGVFIDYIFLFTNEAQ